MVASAEYEYFVVVSRYSRVNSAVVALCELLVVEVGRNYSGKPLILSGIEEIVNAYQRELALEFGTEIVNYKKVALEVFVGNRLLLHVAALEL